jgi:hypothetical protein
MDGRKTEEPRGRREAIADVRMIKERLVGGGEAEAESPRRKTPDPLQTQHYTYIQ